MGRHLWVLISLFEKFPSFCGMKSSKSYHPQPLPPAPWSEWEVTSNLKTFVGSQWDWQRQGGLRWFCWGEGVGEYMWESCIYNKQDHWSTLINVWKIKYLLSETDMPQWDWTLIKYLPYWYHALFLLLLNPVTISTWLLICFPRQEIIEQLLSNIFHKEKNESAIVSAIQILLTLLETRRPT